ncbi:TonB-dependent receptor [Sphingomonas ginkgonis]|uniref:TonB-dependent receptor n=1 Tax=Sphingomonas ginkgonis TaxID=2315330 RepID=A0A3R9WPZ7_9SPHN|nr:TonB-dependent receptor [Sphingomonas ginkgonis]RST30596.1 TonB-dependent receptor [Sphingomonas ginkgonis]
MLPLLLLAGVEAEPIIVTGRGLPPGETAGAASVSIDRERIRQSASGRLEDVLRDVAGVQSFRRSDSRSSHATNQSITLRGLGGNASARALLLLDGVPQGDPFGGWISFPAYATDRIGQVRVTRGGGSGYYGPGALAGTVELESATPSESKPFVGSVAYGSRDSLDVRGSALLTGGSSALTMSGAFARGDGFVPITSSTRGPVDRAAPYKQASGAARYVQQLGQTEAQLNVSGFYDQRDRGVPFTENRGKGIDTSLRLVGKGGTRWSVLGYAQFRNFASQFSSINAARTTSTETLDQYSVPSRGFGFRGEIAPVSGPFDLRVGTDGRFVRGDTKELYQFVAGAPTRRRDAGGRSSTVGAFAVATLTHEPASVSASGRLDRWAISDGFFFQQTLAGATLTNTDFPDRHGWQGSGRLAGEARVAPPLKLRAAAYRGWRLPTLNELYRPFRAGADATAPNPDLRPETMWGGEVGTDLDLPAGWRAALTGYVARLHGAIANVTLGRGPGTFPIVGFVAAGGAYRQRQNLDAIRSRGLEADLSGRLAGLDARLSYAFVDARVDASGPAAVLDGLRPAQTPKHQLSATLGWTGPSGWSVSGTGRVLSAQFDDDLNVRRLHPALTLDSYAALPLGRHLAVELRGENLFNRTVETARGADGSIERALPRTLWLGLRLR